jgi:hypothetical protein
LPENIRDLGDSVTHLHLRSCSLAGKGVQPADAMGIPFSRREIPSSLSYLMSSELISGSASRCKTAHEARHTCSSRACNCACSPGLYLAPWSARERGSRCLVAKDDIQACKAQRPIEHVSEVRQAALEWFITPTAAKFQADSKRGQDSPADAEHALPLDNLDGTRSMLCRPSCAFSVLWSLSFHGIEGRATTADGAPTW